ncbi:hypothetical protein [Lentilactobacillus parakefiri]|uniref:DUF3784 domain-containing protein n=1 Tax=Lentilactobacillus parakefiri TaxID=152332 RepID=A0A269YA56_9LACO|nr:hypothetical protein [Lentilactobacillus parakefiri]KRL70433.1 hypothetical protein FD08_GL001176 [Lentilactobacillus parakefiri DSM 10551]PAK82071.1 hypothetical protein B8W98_07690 [Lentilactobacillus parakefiri]PAK99971.1 hypothetical protein B8W96_09000 [Lentilactobacillus parakefiri]TDG89487.1 hypothetical protein C5L28_002001 [Lentilactobacillus parakefiri]GAW71004.1 hypothetical protein LPKJCM_00075 [Lentilactobacillus parakefiri]
MTWSNIIGGVLTCGIGLLLMITGLMVMRGKWSRIVAGNLFNDDQKSVSRHKKVIGTLYISLGVLCLLFDLIVF